MQDWIGKEVPETQVAEQLGFSDVYEFRRWQTELGHKVKELEHELYTAKQDIKNFKWHGERMIKVLDELENTLKRMQKRDMQVLTDEYIDKLLLAISVVCGREVDWDHKIREWLDV